jgi:hypothetical protein
MEATGSQIIYDTRTTCRACNDDHLKTIIYFGEMYLPRWVKERDDELPKAPLDLVQCGGCGLLQLRHTVDPDLLYREFWYRSGMNQSMRNALISVVETGMEFHHEGVWLDIGANDGYLLSQVPRTFNRIACEPAQNFKQELAANSEQVVSDYFSAEAIGTQCHVITSAAMFYDLDDPNRFIEDVEKLLAKGGVWINQLNDAPTMMQSNAFDSICHEHLCYYDVPTLSKMYRRNGLSIRKLIYNDVNGGSVRVVATRTPKSDVTGMKKVDNDEATGFATRVGQWKERMGNLIVSAKGPVWGYGASTKGGTILQYLGLNEHFVGIADKNPEKHGTMMAGCWIPVTDELALRRSGADMAIVLPWAFRDEFVRREESLRKSGTAMVFPLPNIEVVV